MIHSRGKARELLLTNYKIIFNLYENLEIKL